MVQFKMPQLGETVLEAVVTRWLKNEGEAVEVDDSLVEVSTDKVDSEVPSPASGTLTKILVQEGETVAVGAAMAEIDETGKGDGSASSGSSEPAQEAAPEEEEAAPDTSASAEPSSPEPQVARLAEAPSQAPAPAPPPSQIVPSAAEPMRGVLSPLVRRLAAEHRVDLATIQGSGTGGRITKRDVMAAAASRVGKPSSSQVVELPSPPPPAETARKETVREPGPAGPGEEVVVVSPMRRAIAEHMLNSNVETARAWNTIEVDMSRVAHLRMLAGPSFKNQEGYSLTWMPFVCKAVTQALLKFPLVNSTWNGDGTITKKRYVNLGIAVALENGLIVPVVKGAEAMNIMGLARSVRDVADRARSKKLSPDDVQGGTFTITNPGTFGSILSVPIINRGQAAILSFDAIVKRPVVVTDEFGNDSIGIRHMTFLSISWDHRIMDGAEAAKFLAYLKELLEEADFTSDLGGLLPA